MSTHAASDYDLRFSLRLLSAGLDRLRTMAALRRLRPDLSLQDAKVIIASVPYIVLTNIPLGEREDASRAFLWVADVELVSDWHGSTPASPNEI